MAESQRDNGPANRRRKIAFVCFNTGFFLTHFLPAARAARANGFEVFALLPSVPTTVPLPDITIIPIGAGRSRHPILRLPSHIVALCAALRQCRPDVVQAFALHCCVITTIATWLVPVARKILVVTGLGLIEIDGRLPNRMVRAGVYGLLRFADRAGSTSFVFENGDDPRRIGFAKGRPTCAVTLMGAGVSPSLFAPQDLPPAPPVKFAIVCRMIWSKGVDLAVAAVARLLDEGLPVELDIYGDPDLENQRHISVAQLRDWARRPGIRWHGYVSDIVGVWREHHVALFPSRGGEGLPRALLEAAACGRPLIAANVPGCADFVRPHVDGIVIPPDSVEALEQAMRSLLARPDQMAAMGRSARERLLQQSTEEIIAARYQQFYAKLGL
jgi:glycosyltransferase involved in cell wall biosynthesis